MAGINNFNLGNNLRLQQAQLKSTAKVNVQKADDKDVGDAKEKAVWIYTEPPFAPEGYFEPGGKDVQRGDVIIYQENGRWHSMRMDDGSLTLLDNMNGVPDLIASSMEKDRGDLKTKW